MAAPGHDRLLVVGRREPDGSALSAGESVDPTEAGRHPDVHLFHGRLELHQRRLMASDRAKSCARGKVTAGWDDERIDGPGVAHERPLQLVCRREGVVLPEREQLLFFVASRSATVTRWCRMVLALILHDDRSVRISDSQPR